MPKDRSALGDDDIYKLPIYTFLPYPLTNKYKILWNVIYPILIKYRILVHGDVCHKFLNELKLFLEIRCRYSSTILVKWHYIALHKMSTQVFNTQKMSWYSFMIAV